MKDQHEMEQVAPLSNDEFAMIVRMIKASFQDENDEFTVLALHGDEIAEFIREHDAVMADKLKVMSLAMKDFYEHVSRLA